VRLGSRSGASGYRARRACRSIPWRSRGRCGGGSAALSRRGAGGRSHGALHSVRVEHADESNQALNGRVGQLETRHSPTALTDRRGDGFIGNGRLPIGARQICGVYHGPLRTITATEGAGAARAVLLPGDDRYVVEAVPGFGRARVRDLHLIHIWILGVVVIRGAPRAQICGGVVATDGEGRNHEQGQRGAREPSDASTPEVASRYPDGQAATHCPMQ
jgi:hypothetical protein